MGLHSQPPASQLHPPTSHITTLPPKTKSRKKKRILHDMLTWIPGIDSSSSRPVTTYCVHKVTYRCKLPTQHYWPVSPTTSYPRVPVKTCWHTTHRTAPYALHFAIQHYTVARPSSQQVARVACPDDEAGQDRSRQVKAGQSRSKQDKTVEHLDRPTYGIDSTTHISGSLE